MDLFKEKLIYDSKWEDYYTSRIVTPEEAVSVVKSGDFVITPLPEQPSLLLEALSARASELRDITISLAAPTLDQNWYTPEVEKAFNVRVELFIGSMLRPLVDERKIPYVPDLFSARFKGFDEGRPENANQRLDVFITSVSPPDENGYCSFGHTLWHKRSYAKRAKTVLADINPLAIRTFGSNFIHVSEIDYFVQRPEQPEMTSEEWQEIYKIFPKKTPEEIESQIGLIPPGGLRGIITIAQGMGYENAAQFIAPHLGLDDPTPAAIGIAGHLKELIRDGDTIQVGVGRPSSFMVKLGVFDERNDLGIHSEMGCPGMPLLVKAGVANGKYKTLHPGKAVFSTFMGCDREDVTFIANNPAFEQYDSEYVANIRTTARNDNMRAVNNAMQIDLTGQICSETQFGARMINGQGGQTEMHIGAFLSKGGRAISLLPSTVLGGVSTIVPHLEQGSLVTIPRQFADTVVTEYGIAYLAHKSHRERAEELINVAHPDHREELRKAAATLF
jgi:4-hydroxybutyrate CoA-transferase